MTPERYRLSFTTGGLLHLPAPEVAREYLACGDWQETRDRVRSSNLLQVRTASAALRISRELVSRLAELHRSELEFLVGSDLQDGAHLMWVAACRRYEFIRAFAVEVLRERALLLQRQLAHSDYDAFFNAQALWHPELEELAASTRHKLRQNIFRMLRDAQFLCEQGVIRQATLSPALAAVLAESGIHQFLVFPATDMEINRWRQ